MSIRATQEERAQPLPGDELVPKAKLVTTHAISIGAPPDKVWPWIVQMGQDRGGFYSYTMLENLLGCRMTNADRIHPEWQILSVGDSVSLHPRAKPLRVALIAANQHLVLQSSAGFPWTWAFVLAEESSGCRLLARTRVAWSGTLAGLFLRPVMGPGHYVMESKMLLGIRDRVMDLN